MEPIKKMPFTTEHQEVMNALRKLWEKMEILEEYLRNIEQKFIVKELNQQLDEEVLNQKETEAEYLTPENPSDAP